jgi:hypothetical protein
VRYHRELFARDAVDLLVMLETRARSISNALPESLTPLGVLRRPLAAKLGLLRQVSSQPRRIEPGGAGQ